MASSLLLFTNVGRSKIERNLAVLVPYSSKIKIYLLSHLGLPFGSLTVFNSSRKRLSGGQVAAAWGRFALLIGADFVELYNSSARRRALFYERIERYDIFSNVDD
jgi:hypothetical protein